MPGMCQEVAVANFTYTTAGNLLHTTPSATGVSWAIVDQPTTYPFGAFQNFLASDPDDLSPGQAGRRTPETGRTTPRTLCRAAATIAISLTSDSASLARPLTTQHPVPQANVVAFL